MSTYHKFKLVSISPVARLLQDPVEAVLHHVPRPLPGGRLPHHRHRVRGVSTYSLCADGLHTQPQGGAWSR